MTSAPRWPDARRDLQALVIAWRVTIEVQKLEKGQLDRLLQLIFEAAPKII